jgi:Holliday junction resolvase-like predicted endonuclease
VLSENHVIAAVCALLERAGWTIDQQCSTVERGIDIVARRHNQTVLHVEAKGETSSKPGTSCCGKPFTRTQIATHVARSFYTAATSIESTTPAAVTLRAAIALPATRAHREYVRRISRALARLEVGVFWVEDPRRAYLEASWSL